MTYEENYFDNLFTFSPNTVDINELLLVDESIYKYVQLREQFTNFRGYTFDSKPENLLFDLLSNYGTINNLAIGFSTNNGYGSILQFVDSKPFYSSHDLLPDQIYFSKNLIFLMFILYKFNVENLYFITKGSVDFFDIKFFTLLKKRNPNVNIFLRDFNGSFANQINFFSVIQTPNLFLPNYQTYDTYTTSTSISQNGGFIYLRQNIHTIEYSSDMIIWNEVIFPLSIFNQSQNILTVKLTSDLETNSANGFTTGTVINFKSSYINLDGNNFVVNIIGLQKYGGFTSNLYDYVNISNLGIVGTNSTLWNDGRVYGSGWLGAKGWKSKNLSCIISNCYTIGDIGDYCGGLFGSSSTPIIKNCYTKGKIGKYGGGIMGTENYDFFYITNSYSTGAIGEGAGGIIGFSSLTGGVVIENCYSTGNIGSFGGGIVGSYGYNYSVKSCYSTGNIGEGAGGIVGYASNVKVDTSFSRGDISDYGGGIIGSYCTMSTREDHMTNCYASGKISDKNAGYFAGYCSKVNASYCYSLTSVVGTNVKISATNTYSSGTWSDEKASTNNAGLRNKNTVWSGTNINEPWTLVTNPLNSSSVSISMVSGNRVVINENSENNIYKILSFKDSNNQNVNTNMYLLKNVDRTIYLKLSRKFHTGRYSIQMYNITKNLITNVHLNVIPKTKQYRTKRVKKTKHQTIGNKLLYTIASFGALLVVGKYCDMR